jgi:DNA-binding NarL/FixJ family response regulator
MRIVLAELPRMLRDILHALLDHEPGVIIVGDAVNLEDLCRMVKAGGVDVVMLGLAAAELPASHYRIFDADRRIRILAIADHGRNASLYELRPRRVVLGEGTVQDLIEVLREHLRGRWRQEAAEVPPAG